VIVLISGYVQQAQIQGRSTNQTVNPQQQMIMKILPAFIGLISFGLPGALVLYFVTSNLFRVGQQFLITHTIYKDDALQAGVIDADAEEKPKPSGNKPKKPPSDGSGSTGTKGRPTPPRNPGGGAASSNGKGKGSNKRTTAGRGDSNKGSSGPSLPQPRPRKKKR
jgi:YidC/Oxa1 family membrane protein insertase